MIRHFTTAVYVFDDAGRVLLLWHGKFRKWMPPGGHVDENEMPEECAVRECKEETGLDVEIVCDGDDDYFGSTPDEGRMMKLPFAMTLENIPAFPGSATKPPQPAHQHMDFQFKARLKDPNQSVVREHPDAEVRWFTMDDVRAIPAGKIHANVRAFLLGS
jgi:8-oxo-dGTP pyrophosphatase MutT (NUDIX family)